jgi:hypothetical protein
MRPTIWTVLALASLTAACAGTTPTVTPVATGAVVSSAPVPVPGYDWHLTPEADTARLAYGVEASDDLKLGLDCEAGSNRVVLTALAKTGERVIHLEAGGETERFRADGEPSQVHDGDILTAEADLSEPVLQRFRRLGWIARLAGSEREVYAPHPGSEAEVERFFAVCD